MHFSFQLFEIGERAHKNVRISKCAPPPKYDAILSHFQIYLNREVKISRRQQERERQRNGVVLFVTFL